MSKKINADFGFIIIAPDHNVGRVRSTLTSIGPRFPDVSTTCVVGENAHPDAVQQISSFCPIFKGGATITSLINTGIRKSGNKWNVLVFEGSLIDFGTIRKIFNFATSEKDVLYPIIVDYDKMGKPVKLHNDFVDATLSGLTIHTDSFNHIGDFTDSALDISKTLWASNAVRYGCLFKGILGAKII